MSTDYSFYALLCGFMPHPEGVLKREEREFFSFFCCVLAAERCSYTI